MRMDFIREQSQSGKEKNNSHEVGTFRITGRYDEILSLGCDLSNMGYQGVITHTPSKTALDIMILNADSKREMRRIYRQWRATHLIT